MYTDDDVNELKDSINQTASTITLEKRAYYTAYWFGYINALKDESVLTEDWFDKLTSYIETFTKYNFVMKEK